MTLKLNRNCWLCNKPLMAVSHAEVATPDGIVWTHKVCEKDTRDYFRRETATLGQPTPNLAGQFYEGNK